ncbi:VC0807 family protein [Nonomuraea sp. B12E4]|uniref:VC0807 family protein n=1 Tax=Nonomuraea sp. B12E4 TaxID=3153564 RepID=UPI00325D8624
MDKRALLMGLLWDIGLPAAAYYACRGLGAEAWLALVAGGAVALARVACIAVTRRRLDGVAAIVAVTFVLLLAMSALTGDPRILLARESLLSGALGLLLLGSCAVGRPVLYGLVRRLNSGNQELLARWDELWPAQPSFRRVFVLLSLVWGTGLLAEAVVRIPLIYLLPVDAAAGVSTLLQLGTIALLVGWSVWYRGRRLRAAAAASHDMAGSHAR